MKKIFSARIDNCYFSIINAANLEEAMDIVTKNILENDSLFFDYINNLSIDGTLLNQFLSDKDTFLVDDILSKDIEYPSEYVNLVVYRNLKKFWPSNPLFVDEYYYKWNKHLHNEESEKISLSKELTFSAAKKVLMENTWYSEIQIIELDLNTTHQLIYFK